jgi:exodeoxyribonuclease I
MNYVFYDFETTGTNVRYDQFHQLGAILTNNNFEELDRVEIRCRLSDHIVPAPRALEVTKIPPSLLIDPSIDSFYQATLRLHKKFSDWGPATFVGYNSFSFDEEIMRQSFYQNLLPPYLTNTNGNKRADALTLIKAIRSLNPNAMAFPLNDKGNPVLKLDQLAPINGFDHSNAHDAVSDVEATIFIVKLICERDPTLFKNIMGLGEKKRAKSIVEQNQIFALTQYHNGKVKNKFVIPLAHNPINESEIVLFDLEYEPEDYANQSVEDVIKAYKKSKRPYQKIKLNKQPLVFALGDLPKGILLPEIEPELLKQRKVSLEKMLSLKQNNVSALENIQKEYEGAIELEDQIYDGFFPPEDVSLMKSFHIGSVDKKLSIINNFKDRRSKGLANRIIFAEHPELLSKQTRVVGEEWSNKRLTDNSGAWRTVEQSISELDQIDCTSELGKEIEVYLKKKSFKINNL